MKRRGLLLRYRGEGVVRSRVAIAACLRKILPRIYPPARLEGEWALVIRVCHGVLMLCRGLMVLIKETGILLVFLLYLIQHRKVAIAFAHRFHPLIKVQA